ncbi:1-deoxy-D-xylulose-5-phosphate synthase [Acetobacterium fimetarium]|uniref:1-deoxy-D-xylulose-5-phosphate synthase n=1 Tax=Acetobacterium fimetarium TaxID=52691 RepID=A0ABR6WRM6_9FIRM|nr:1-deoxy-D-xylulose-5-phosphate synthase [Acetobacterium fimetarium]MBC3803286.1 1-deoxy-D-xylulose-5-phosphate synthase [Acetobacterium fimetarium]
MSILKSISSPNDLKGLSYRDLEILADELRNEILNTVSNNGGHLASNLGIVETMISIHRIFNSPEDQIVLDVGHQSYVHKLLTGRQGRFDTLRQWNGISGFTNREESEYDPFGAGHSGTSISAALGLATANLLNGSPNYVIAVVGDGSFTNGMIYEALNNCTKNNLKLIIILNDNEMSISENVGGLSKYLSRIRTSEKYFTLKHQTQRFFRKIPLVGENLVMETRKLKKRFKKRVMSENLFENLGLDYLGPIDGSDQKKLETVLREAKDKNRCCLVHVHTVKGKGYQPAEDNPEIYHSVGSFDLEKGVDPTNQSTNFSSVFGDILCREAAQNPSVCAITAAMTSGTGLSEFRKKHRQRFFDVGIAEEHAVTFAAGLSANGKLPVCAVYSTFTQRVYDQLIHDVAIQKLPLIMALDRCGLVPGDGITHQGIYDCSYLSSIPGITIFSPETYAEMEQSFNQAFHHNGLTVIRYPKGAQSEYDRSQYQTCGEVSYQDFGKTPGEVAVITYGRITKNVHDAIASLNAKISVRLIKLVKVHPLDFESVFTLIEATKKIYIVEEGIKNGGVAEKLAAGIAQNEKMGDKTVSIRAIDDPLIEHGDLTSLYESCGFLSEQIFVELNNLIHKSI